MAKTPTYTTTVDSANHVTTDTIEDFTIVEANSTGVEYRTNEKIDGEWIYAKTFHTTDTTAVSFSPGSIPAGSVVLKMISLLQDNSLLWRPAVYNDSGTRAEMTIVESTGIITMNLASFTVNGTRTTIHYTKP